MTCIVGYLEPNRMWIGGDSAATSRTRQTIRADAKIFRSGGFLFGFTDSFRMGQLLRYKFRPPEHRLGVSAFQYMVEHFVDAVRKTFQDGGFTKKSDNEERGGTFLALYRGHLFVVQSDFQVSEPRLPYAAIGSGSEVALGAMHILQTRTKMGARQKIRCALAAAAKFDSAVAPPFSTMSLADWETT